MNWLLIFVPISIGLEFLAPERYLLVFVTSALAILPLAGWLGRATEQRSSLSTKFCYLSTVKN
jgi:Ca2+:H+ antiporter